MSSITVGGGGFASNSSGFSNILDTLKLNADLEAKQIKAESATFTGDVEVLGLLSASLDASDIANLQALLNTLDFSEADIFRITGLEIDGSGNIIATFSDDTTLNLGQPGTSALVVESVTIDNSGDVVVSYTDDSVSVLDLPFNRTPTLAMSVSNDSSQELFSITHDGVAILKDGTNTPFITDTSNNIVQITNLVTTNSFTNYSDQRIKDNIKPCSLPGIETIDKIGVYEFNRTDLPDKPFVSAGFVAQDIERVVPNFVSESLSTLPGIDKIKTVKTLDVVPLLVKAVQELSASNKELRSQVQLLNERMNIL